MWGKTIHKMFPKIKTYLDVGSYQWVGPQPSPHSERPLPQPQATPRMCRQSCLLTAQHQHQADCSLRCCRWHWQWLQSPATESVKWRHINIYGHKQEEISHKVFQGHITYYSLVGSPTDIPAKSEQIKLKFHMIQCYMVVCYKHYSKLHLKLGFACSAG